MERLGYEEPKRKAPRSKSVRPAPVRQAPVTKKQMVQEMLKLTHPDMSVEEKAQIQQVMVEKGGQVTDILDRVIAQLKKSKEYKNQPRDVRLQLAAETIARDRAITSVMARVEESKLNVASQQLLRPLQIGYTPPLGESQLGDVYRAPYQQQPERQLGDVYREPYQQPEPSFGGPLAGSKRVFEAEEQRPQPPKVGKAERPRFGKTGMLQKYVPPPPKPTARKGLKEFGQEGIRVEGMEDYPVVPFGREVNEEKSVEIGLERPADRGGARKRQQKEDVRVVGMDEDQMVPYVAPRKIDVQMKQVERFEQAQALPSQINFHLAQPAYLPAKLFEQKKYEVMEGVMPMGRPYGWGEGEEAPQPQPQPRLGGYTDEQQADVLFLAERMYDRARTEFKQRGTRITPEELMRQIAEKGQFPPETVAAILRDRALLGSIRDMGSTEMFERSAPFQEEKGAVPDAKAFTRKAENMLSFFSGGRPIAEQDEDVEMEVGVLEKFDSAARLWAGAKQLGSEVGALVEAVPGGIVAANKVGESAFAVIRGLGHGLYHAGGAGMAIYGGNPQGLLEHGIGLGEVLNELSETVKGSEEAMVILGKLGAAWKSAYRLSGELYTLGADVWNKLIPDRLAEMPGNLRQAFELAWRYRPGFQEPKMIEITYYDGDNVPRPDLTLINQDLSSDLKWAGQHDFDSSNNGQTSAMDAPDHLLAIEQAEQLPLNEQPIDASGQLVAYDEFDPSKDKDIFTQPLVPTKMLKNTLKAPPLSDPKGGYQRPKQVENVAYVAPTKPGAPQRQIEEYKYEGRMEQHRPLAPVAFEEEKQPPPRAPPVPEFHQQPQRLGKPRGPPMIKGAAGPHIVQKAETGLGGARPTRHHAPQPPPQPPQRHPPPQRLPPQQQAEGKYEERPPMDQPPQPVPIWGQEEDDSLYSENGVQPWLPEQPRANASAFPMRTGDDRATAIASAAMQNWQPDHEHPEDNMYNNPLMMDNAMELAIRFHEPMELDYPEQHWSDNPEFYTETAQALGEGYLRGLQAGHATPQPMNPNFERERAMNQPMVDINEQQGWCDVFPDAETQDRDERTSYVDSRWPY